MKQQLKNAVSKQVQTIMIYPLSQFELMFGHLWGHGKEEHELTDEERYYREKWKQCRKNILDHSNKHKKNIDGTLDLYRVEWCGYQTKLYPKEKGNTRYEE